MSISNKTKCSSFHINFSGWELYLWDAVSYYHTIWHDIIWACIEKYALTSKRRQAFSPLMNLRLSFYNDEFHVMFAPSLVFRNAFISLDLFRGCKYKILKSTLHFLCDLFEFWNFIHMHILHESGVF